MLSGTAEIRDGPSSEAPLLFTFKGSKTRRVADLVPFQGAHGLYVRVKKPLEGATAFRFSYGAFHETKENNTEEPRGE